MPIPGLSELAEGAEHLAQKGIEKLVQTDTGKSLYSMAGNEDAILHLKPVGHELAGETLEKMHLEYLRRHEIALGQANANIEKLRDWHSSDATARNQLPKKTTTMAEYHAHAVATGHPVQKVTQAILNSDVNPKTGVSENLHLTTEQMHLKNMQLARLQGLAAEGSYGSNFEHAIPIVAGLLRDKNPEVVQYGHMVADIVSHQVRDTMPAHSSSGVNSAQSLFKMNVNNATAAAEKSLELPAKTFSRLNTDPTYIKPSEAERKAHRVMDVMLLSQLSIKHITQGFNVPATSPLPAIGAALLRMNKEEMDHTIQATHILAANNWSAIYRDILGENGRVAEWTHSPTAGKILARTIHQPGFNWLRGKQLQMAGDVGYQSAIYWAHNYVKKGSKIAEAQLREMQIDPAEVLKQGGKLTDAQLQKGVFHFTNDRMFISKGLDKSLWQDKNVWTRSMFMFHGFVNHQAAFIRKQVMLMAKNRDYVGLAQFAGTIGVIVPTFSTLIAGLETLATTGSMERAKSATEDRFSRLYKPRGTADWFENYASLLSFGAAWGVYFTYLKALQANRVVGAMAGPIPGILGEDAYDAYNAGTGHSSEPLKRDILKQTVPVVGSILAHQLYPTKREEGTSSKLFSRLRRHTGRRR